MTNRRFAKMAIALLTSANLSGFILAKALQLHTVASTHVGLELQRPFDVC